MSRRQSILPHHRSTIILSSMLRAHIQVRFFHFALALFLLVLLMPYNCVPGCTESYTRESNLRNHQSTCSIAQTHRVAIRKLRGSEGHKSLNERALSSLDDRKNRIYVSRAQTLAKRPPYI